MYRPGTIFTLSACRGFTLIEIMIVVVIMGILAAVVLPQFSNATQLSRENTLKDDLRYLRTQIGIFKAQHHDSSPGYPAGDMRTTPAENLFVGQMSQWTDEFCTISTTGGGASTLGPYLPMQGEMIPNPINKSRRVLMVGNAQSLPEPTGQCGWIYKALTGEIIPDLVGADSDGKAFSQY